MDLKRFERRGAETINCFAGDDSAVCRGKIKSKKSCFHTKSVLADIDFPR